MPLKRLVTALVTALGLLATSVPAGALAGSSEYGPAWRKNGVLREGCRDYTFQYRVKPGNVHPGEDWAAEFFLTDRRGKGLGTVIKDSAIDPKRGQGVYEICRNTAEPGRFKIRGKLSVDTPDDGNPLTPPEVDTVKWIKPGYFRLRLP